jgi:hypothetical protein
MVKTHLEALLEFAKSLNLRAPDERLRLLGRTHFLADAVALRGALWDEEERRLAAELLVLAVEAAQADPGLQTGLLEALLAVLQPADPDYARYAVTLCDRWSAQRRKDERALALYRYVLECSQVLDPLLRSRLAGLHV